MEGNNELKIVLYTDREPRYSFPKEPFIEISLFTSNLFNKTS